MEARKGILISVFAIVFLIGTFYFVSFNISKYTGMFISDSSETAFEKCLDGKDITLYVNSENVSQSLNNSELIGYLDNIKIVNCLRNNNLCNKKGIDSFPILSYSNKVSKEISVAKLAELSGC